MVNPEKEEEEEAKHEIKYRGVKAMPYIIGNETFEKLGTLGTQSNLLVYLTTVFGMKTITATNVVNVFTGSANFATLIGAFLSDTYYGRYNTLAFSSVSSFMGMVMLTLTAAINDLHPNQCPSHPTNCAGPTTGQLAVLLTGLALLVVGAGGIRPCNLAFGADQFDPSTESGKRGTASFFNWYYFTFTFAVMVSMTFIVYVQSDVSWALGLAIPAFLMLLSCAVFFVGTRIYVRLSPQGSPLVSVAQVIVAAFKKRRLRLDPDMPMAGLLDHENNGFVNSQKIPYTDQFRFLDKGAIITEEDQVNVDGTPSNPWRLISIHQSEEVKCILRILPIWFSAILYFTSHITLQNYVVFQALQSNRHLTPSFQIPAASYSFFTMLAVALWLPLYDRLIVPVLTRVTGHRSGISLLQKIGVGILIVILSMALSSYIEYKRRIRVSQSGFWLVPQLILAGVSEAFTAVGLVEFYYKEVSERMRSIGGSFFFTGLAISSYLSSFLESVVDRVSGDGGKGVSWLSEDLNLGRLDLFYGMIAGLEAVNLMYFLVCAKWYRYKGDGVLAEKENVGVEREKTPPKPEAMDNNKEKTPHEEVESNRIKYPGIKAMPFIIGNETFEKLGAIGTLSNLLVYLTTVFNLKSITATTIVNVFYGTTNFATLLGAFLCDSYFGRFITLGFSTFCSFLGLVVIALTAVAKNLHPPRCAAKDESCTGPTPWQMAFLMMGFGLMIVGAAGVRPCNLAFGADQFDPASDSGKRGITSFFNWMRFYVH
ncbi:hypothetical protein V2J09_020497 [Rumex salicifolius]